MSDFTSSFWAIFITVIVLVGIFFNLWLLIPSKNRVQSMTDGSNTTGHVWDEDLCELNNPLPRWWVGLFIITCVFALGYLALYPGLGTYKGLLGWTSHNQFDQEVRQGNEQIAPIYERFRGMTAQQLAKDPDAMAIGDRLFMNNCSQCHGTDAKGAMIGGFPNLTDKDWIWGGTPDAIHTTISGGRTGMMPSQGAVLGSPDEVRDVANYVLGLAGQHNDPVAAAKGEAKFKTICAACHGPDGKGSFNQPGSPPLGAPNLTAPPSAWYIVPPTEEGITKQINNGHTGVMPTWKGKLTDDQISILTAYVWGKGGGQESAAPTAAATEAPAVAADQTGMGGMSGMNGMSGMDAASAAAENATPAAAENAASEAVAGDKQVAPNQ